MAKPTGFMEFSRAEVPHRHIEERVLDYREIDLPLAPDVIAEQAARCMDCGIPFCHGAGCPVKNRIPEFNDLVYKGRWREACDNLHSTNNFPEITGRVCPAPCEASCTLNINDNPVLIKHIEYQIVERGFAEGWVHPLRPARRSGKRVAVVGSGPAGLAAAQQLARAGHDVVVFEKDDRVGGLLRYGIPDFKLDKRILDRRLKQLVAEGIKFETGVAVGQDISPRYLKKMFDAICLSMGAGEPRRLAVPGSGFENIHLAMDFLTQQNRVVAGDAQPAPGGKLISAKGKIVVVIGGGDTGSDCVGTALRQGAKEVHQFEILPKPPDRDNPATPWPLWPQVLRTSTSQEEGCRRRWSVLTRRFSGVEVRVTELHACEVDWSQGPKGWEMKERPNSDFSMKVDLVLLAMGFVHVAHEGLVEQLGLTLDPRGNLLVRDCQTSEEGVFAAGDAAAGASLVVRAINSGREAAEAIHRWLTR
ncbi:MAG: glutamate synthase subunit beta [Pirellulales bacterium]